MKGDYVTVHYIGSLPNGQQFDNSYKKGEPFSFKVGDGKVIAGWEEGILGMKVGGQRILVIPASMAYGSKAMGPIPGGSNLVFTVELLSIE
ncbi:peptidylprolyl isomerase [bacterium]|nr:peptidylprolyl isomerase [bacterium]